MPIDICNGTSMV